MEHISNNLEDTKKIAVLILDTLKDENKHILSLYGNLGSGKTQLVKCMAEELGIEASVTSPTFILRNDYITTDETFKTMSHIDLYRIENKEEIETIGLNDIMSERDRLVVIEWADRIDKIPNSLKVQVFVKGDKHTYTV